MRKLIAGASLIALTYTTPALAFGDIDNTQNNTNSAFGGAGGAGGEGGTGVGVGGNATAVSDPFQKQKQGQAQDLSSKVKVKTTDQLNAEQYAKNQAMLNGTNTATAPTDNSTNVSLDQPNNSVSKVRNTNTTVAVGWGSPVVSPITCKLALVQGAAVGAGGIAVGVQLSYSDLDDRCDREQVARYFLDVGHAAAKGGDGALAGRFTAASLAVMQQYKPAADAMAVAGLDPMSFVPAEGE